MAYPLKITVQESIKDLKSLQRQYGELIGKRLRVLIEIKRHEKMGISKRELSAITGVNHNSIVKWRQMYNEGGLASLLVHNRQGGYKKSVIPQQAHDKIEQKLKDPENGISGYVELVEWVKEELSLDIKYITLLKYTQRHFGAKIKVARKSHVKKNEEAVSAFKKTSVGNVSK